MRLDNNTYLKIKEIMKRLERLVVDKPSINMIEINKFKNYYPRLSLVDIQYEERGDLVRNSFSGNEISEWNLDGMSEQEILDLTCQMTMVATTHKTKGCFDKSIALAIIQGFIGQLKEHERLTILNSVKSETNQEDAVATLIYRIIQNFTGDLNIFKHRAANQLTNLYCPTMSDYRWYNDTFYQKHYGQPIGYESLTYGQLHNVIVEIGIQVCTDFKLQNKMRKEKLSSKRELGIFCYQYGVEPIRAPSAHHKKKQNQKDIIINLINNIRDRPTKIRKHYANKCRFIQKINELEDETLKKNLLNILINSEHEESFSEELEDSEDNLELEQLEMLNTSSSSKEEEDDNYCLGVGICTCN
ncbi:hypothetical protein CR513_27086, partial [Mucuna pruriens]